jgi:hypothetical protein
MIEVFKKSDVEIMLSTMNRNSMDFLLPMFPFAHFSDFNILIINQTTKDKILESQYPNVRVINVFERGLSRSRNLAVANVNHRIGLVADDDLVFVQGFDEKIARGFNRFKEAAIIKFVTTTFEGVPFRKYPKTPRAKLTAMQRLNSTSWEMALNIDVVRKSGILFNTNFGLGSTFPLGEEPVLINDLYQKGYQICHEPEIIVTHKEFKDSDNITVEENYRIRGAYLYTIFGKAFPLWLGIQLMYHVKQGIVKPHQILHYIKIAVKGKNESISLLSK